MTTSGFLQLSKTATDDNPFQLAQDHLLMLPCDILVLTNDCYMGDAKNQSAPIFAGDVYTATQTMPIDVGQLFFKNKVAGSNTVIVIQGLVVG